MSKRKKNEMSSTGDVAGYETPLEDKSEDCGCGSKKKKKKDFTEAIGLSELVEELETVLKNKK